MSSLDVLFALSLADAEAEPVCQSPDDLFNASVLEKTRLNAQNRHVVLTEHPKTIKNQKHKVVKSKMAQKL